MSACLGPGSDATNEAWILDFSLSASKSTTWAPLKMMINYSICIHIYIYVLSEYLYIYIHTMWIYIYILYFTLQCVYIFIYTILIYLCYYMFYTYSILLTEALRILRCIYSIIYIYLHSIVLLDFLFCRGVSRYFFSMCSQINKCCFQNDFCDKSPHHLCDTWKNLL